jgi:hypothetical protein
MISTFSGLFTALAMLSGCYGPAAHLPVPQNLIQLEEVLGMWVNEQEETVEFSADGVVNVAWQSFNLGGSGTEIINIYGTWKLCGNDHFTKVENERGVEVTVCEESESGLWVQMELEGRPRMDPLILAEIDDKFEFYRYNVDVALDSPGERFTQTTKNT